MRIGSKNTADKVIVIAEIGNNHEGDIGHAKELIYLAAEAGTDAVKFQAIIPENLVHRSESGRLEQLKKLCLDLDDFEILRDVSVECGVDFLCTPFCFQSLALVEKLCPAIKISSGDNDFYPLIDMAIGTSKNLLISTGMSREADIKHLCEHFELEKLRLKSRSEICLMHCISSYPADPASLNMRVLNRLRELGYTLGYSDHSIGVLAPVVAVAFGVRVVEKHFTSDKNFSEFRDHKLSADPADLVSMIEQIRLVELMLGSSDKTRVLEDVDSIRSMRRSPYLRNDQYSNSFLGIEDVDFVRPRKSEDLLEVISKILRGDTLNSELNKGDILTKHSFK